MTRDDTERLGDVLSAIRRIRRHRSRTGVPADLLRDAVSYQLIVIGEAVKGMGVATRERRPEVGWREIAGLRDRLTHEYFRIESIRIDELLGEPLDALEQAIDGLLLEDR